MFKDDQKNTNNHIINIIFPNNVHSLIEVDITRGNLNPLPIAVSPLFSDEKYK